MANPPEPETTNGESRPSACPACGYDVARVGGVTCPECGVNVVEECKRLSAERTRLGPRRSVMWVLVPLGAGALIWTWIGQVPFALASQYPFDPFESSIAWFVWAVMFVQLCAFAISVVFVRKIARAPYSTHKRLTLMAWLLMTVPFVLLVISMG